MVTDHKALEFWKCKELHYPHHIHWYEYLEHFDNDMIHIKGEDNKVTDCFSHYYESDTVDDIHPDSDYVNADWCLDPDGELPVGQVAEVVVATIN
ncbi:MAG: hypothetical protein ACREHG_04620 [Candidatus Saccharimonadales bacterium]